MSFKAIAFDLDGTLLDSQRRIRPSSIKAINAARACGLEVIIVTGRHHMVTRPYHYELGLDTPAICCNGAYLHDFGQGKALIANPIVKENAEHLLQLTAKHGVIARILTADAMHYITPDRTLLRYMEWGESLPESLRPVVRQHADYTSLIASAPTIYGFVIVDPTFNAVKALEHDIKTEIGLSCEWFAEDGFDIANHGNSKGGRLLEWAAAKGIAASEIIAFGDNHNDASMLDKVGLGVAMGNARDTIKACAKIVAPGDNNSDAIAEVLRYHVL